MAEPKQPIDPQKEIEIQVGELEERVDRLRAIYEQYFMGYEKLEPTVPRKDVDRRFVQLRKANIRNTALRFRFNVVTQKFNTYAMYWTRICRQIEEGTFKRHIQKANKRFGTRAAKNNDEFSIDVELGDFEVDMDDFDTNEPAEAAAEGVATPSGPASDGSKRAAAAGFGPIDDDEADTVPPSAPGAAHQQRVARHAVLPAGAKARVLVKKGGPQPGQPNQPPAQGARARMPSMTDEAGAAPVSGPASPASGGARPRMPSFTNEEAPPSRGPAIRRTADAPPPGAVRPPMGSVPDAPSTSVIRAATPQTPHGHVHRPPPGLVRPQISPNAQSVRRIPAAAPSEPQAAPGSAPSVGRVPAAARQEPAAARPPAAAPQPAPPQTSVKTPAMPFAPPGAPPPMRAPTSTRMPVGLPSSVNRVPAPTPAAPTPAAQRPAVIAPPSERRLPVPPPSQRTPVAPVRPPAPSVPDSEQGPQSRRPPPPLPSQIKKG